MHQLAYFVVWCVYTALLLSCSKKLFPVFNCLHQLCGCGAMMKNASCSLLGDIHSQSWGTVGSKDTKHHFPCSLQHKHCRNFHVIFLQEELQSYSYNFTYRTLWTEGLNYIGMKFKIDCVGFNVTLNSQLLTELTKFSDAWRYQFQLRKLTKTELLYWTNESTWVIVRNIIFCIKTCKQNGHKTHGIGLCCTARPSD